MSGMEFNKLFAAILVAGIIAMLSGFIARTVIHAEAPEEDAFPIEAAEGDAGHGGLAVAETPEPILGLLADADAAKGEKLSKVCAACHTFEKGAPARVGPNLWNIIGSNHAHMEGFAYSEAMKGVHEVLWSYKELNAYLWNPKKHIPGNKMVFAGLKKQQDRADIIAWLRQQADNPQPLPSKAEIAAEAPSENEEEAEEQVEENAAQEAIKTPEAVDADENQPSDESKEINPAPAE